MFYHYLSISSKNNLSDIGKAKLKRTRLSSSRVTKPSPRLSNATNARLMLPWFSSIWGERKELLAFHESWVLECFLFETHGHVEMSSQELLIALWVNKLQLLLHTNSPHWSPYRLYIKKSWLKQLLKDQSILLLSITFNSHNLSTWLCFEFCLEEINFLTIGTKRVNN